MKMIKTILPLFCALTAAFAAHATILLEDSANYPYNNGPIEGQGGWYSTSPFLYPHVVVDVTNNIVLLNPTNEDTIATPTNGWTIPPTFDQYTYTSFRIMVNDLPAYNTSSNGEYFFYYQNDYTNDSAAAAVGRLFIDQKDIVIPGTFRIGVANYATEFGGLGSIQPPHNFPMDLATNTWYTVVVLWDNDSADNYYGASLWVNPSLVDYTNWINGTGESAQDPGVGQGFAYGNDVKQETTADENLQSVQQVVFDPSSYCGLVGISNLIVGTDNPGYYGTPSGFQTVLITNLPVFGIQPVGGANYSGNSATFVSLASGADVTYQWYDLGGALSDSGGAYTGSQSNILVVNSLSANDTYYCVATDAYGKQVSSSNAVEGVITTPTAPFFANQPALNLTNSLFANVTISDVAEGTGPLYYQWYFAPTNLPLTFTQLVNQVSSNITLNLADFSYQGSYYVVASNSVNGGSITYGPTNTLVETNAANASFQQLHQLVYNFIHAPGSAWGTSPSSQFNLISFTTVSGYVTTRTVAPGDGLGNAYQDIFIEDTNGDGIVVYWDNGVNTNSPPLGANITVSGAIDLFDTELEMEPAVTGGIVTNENVPPITIAPKLANSMFNQLATNMLSSNDMQAADTLITLTNVYLYDNRLGASVTNINGKTGIFYPDSYTIMYCTVGGPYNPTNPATGQAMNPAYPVNTNTLTVYQFAYNYPPTAPYVQYSSFYNQTIPLHLAQLTGTYVAYESTAGSPSPEIEPSVFSDYVTNPPQPPVLTATVSQGGATVSWLPQVGSTYSVYSATNLLGPWTQAASGLAYFPTNGAFTDTSGAAKAKFYQVTSP